jgi:hypothetical protein
VRSTKRRASTSERRQTPFQKRLWAIWTRSNGAAQESNLPSRGLRDLTGFEDASRLAQPCRLRGVRASSRASVRTIRTQTIPAISRSRWLPIGDAHRSVGRVPWQSRSSVVWLLIRWRG